MYARVAQFEGVNIEAAKRTMEEADSIIQPLMEALPGFAGELMLVSPTGRFVSIALFDTEANAVAAEPTFDQELPEKLGHLFKEWAGTRTSVERYEVAVDTRT